VLLRHLVSPSAYAVGGALYVTDARRTGTTLLRVNRDSGAIEARRTFRRDDVAATLIADYWLWVTIKPWNQHRPSWLLRLDPKTLQVLSQTRLRDPTSDDLAVAGSNLWVGDAGHIDQVAVIGGAITARLPIRGAKQISLFSSRQGKLLLLSEGDDSGHGWIERRDPYTGALDARSAEFLGATIPRLGGTAGNGLWISEATGLQGYVERLNVATLRPLHALQPPLDTTNAVRASVIDGVLFVSDPRGADHNYCADPVSGDPRVTMPVGEQRGFFLTADSSRIYYSIRPLPPA
jgi:hypothetical protein